MSDRYQDNNKGYWLEAVQMRILDKVKTRLYDDRPLTGDQRRDLANTLDAIMHGAGEFEL
jgi:hypothetical protein